MRRVALIGRPLRRRHSQVMHAAAYRHFGVDASYELHELAEPELAGFVAAAREPDWLGFQVTAPYKQAVVPLLDELDDTARGIGAVNTVLNENGALVGTNTDAPGFRIAAERELGVRLAGTAVTVVGAGGAAHAVVHACVDAGASAVTVANRTPERAEALAARFARCRPVALSDPAAAVALRGTDLLVSASTAGMTSDDCPVDVALLPASAAVFDCVYTPAETPLLRAARARGLRGTNGIGMLVEQAAVAFARLTGIRADPGPVMRTALSPLLGT